MSAETPGGEEDAAGHREGSGRTPILHHTAESGFAHYLRDRVNFPVLCCSMSTASWASLVKITSKTQKRLFIFPVKNSFLADSWFRRLRMDTLNESGKVHPSGHQKSSSPSGGIPSVAAGNDRCGAASPALPGNLRLNKQSKQRE